MLGRAAVAMWWDIAPEVKSEWEDWHTHEHMPERLAIPGFLRGTRWISTSGDSSYFILYEAAELTAITSGPYIDRLNHPTPWSRKMMPHHRNMVRSLCSVRASFGIGVPQAVATIRFSPHSGGVCPALRWLAEEAMPKLAQRKGLTGAHLLQSEPMTGLPQTTEQKIRGGDAPADWALLVGGYDAAALKVVAEREIAPGLPAADPAFYRVAYSLTSEEQPWQSPSAAS